jgi:hypothetical protein
VCSLEVLQPARAFQLLSPAERAEVPALSRLRIRFPGIETIFASFQFLIIHEMPHVLCHEPTQMAACLLHRNYRLLGRHRSPRGHRQKASIVAGAGQIL